MNRKYLIRKLNQKKGHPRRQPSPKYTYKPAIYLPILQTIWLASDPLCSKKLKVALPEWLPFYDIEFNPIDPNVKEKLLQMSAVTIDRLLKPTHSKYHQKSLGGTKSGRLIKHQIPIKTNQWEESVLGFIEADTVAHCSNRLEDDFVWSLTMCDIFTTWTENRATWNKGTHGIEEKIDDVESVLPFEFREFDTDCGSEFLNYHLINKFAGRPKEKAI